MEKFHVAPKTRYEQKIDPPWLVLENLSTTFPWKPSQPYLEDHPMTCKWLITMVRFRPLNGVIPLINGLAKWLVNRGDPNHLPVLG